MSPLAPAWISPYKPGSRARNARQNLHAGAIKQENHFRHSIIIYRPENPLPEFLHKSVYPGEG